MADIAVIVVNYGTWELSAQAVQSVLEHSHDGYSVEIHLVDNASPEGDGERLCQLHAARGWQGQVTLWRETVNHGFGRGNNVVLDRLLARPAAQAPRFAFLLNPDAALENGALAVLARFLEAHPQAGAAGAKITKPSGVAVSAAFRFPTALSSFVHAVNFGPVARAFPQAAVALPPDTGLGEVDWVSGAAVMLRLETLRRTGTFDPEFFLYFEETELMHRIRADGWQIWHVPQARVLHAEGAATDVRSHDVRRKRKPRYWYDSWRIYHRKCDGRSGAILSGLAWMAGAALNAPLAFLRRQRLQAPLYFFRDFPAQVLWPLVRGR
ncbi:glycosyltransferase (plasmid) [Thioclava sp. 'Guangxiensis']|uniref:glycosyltransferase n=1 Tax=Thioclava sp. 'Guangxiensis' TaxID=3149044 RepID=UPI0032C457C0